ncbi:hypothetical protein CF319_g6846 [Tilletia indica]|nr:hypothetical protein CF319_g6846 [Tilletia indica]KAE8229517.1 hypothetical protein CF326_g5513 [Tilletia indica]
MFVQTHEPSEMFKILISTLKVGAAIIPGLIRRSVVYGRQGNLRALDDFLASSQSSFKCIGTETLFLKPTGERGGFKNEPRTSSSLHAVIAAA